MEEIQSKTDRLISKAAALGSGLGGPGAAVAHEPADIASGLGTIESDGGGERPFQDAEDVVDECGASPRVTVMRTAAMIGGDEQHDGAADGGSGLGTTSGRDSAQAASDVTGAQTMDADVGTVFVPVEDIYSPMHVKSIGGDGETSGYDISSDVIYDPSYNGVADGTESDRTFWT